MKVLLSVLALCSSAWAYYNEDIVKEVNSNPKSTWTAGKNDRFHGRTLEEMRNYFKTYPSPPAFRMRHADLKKSNIGIATSFDSRTQWPRCPSINMIRDQAECGSCWAFGATEAFTDRYCIASGQHQNPIFAPYYMVTCDQNDNGCEGGSLGSAWSFIENSGLPLESCQPYTIPTCPPATEPCLNFVPTPSCTPSSCTNGTGTFTTYHVSNVITPGCGYFDCSADEMAAEIAKNGPIEVAFTVYEDFVHYKSGVYQHTSGQALGGHAVKIIGWGVENNVPYWLIANSWTTTWGDKGYFKILRGSNECGIESDTAAGTPIVKN